MKGRHTTFIINWKRERTKAGQPLLLLLLCTVGIDGMHDQRGLDTHSRAVTTVDSIMINNNQGGIKINAGLVQVGQQGDWINLSIGASTDKQRHNSKERNNEPLDLAGGETVGDRRDTGASVSLNGRSQKTELSHLRQDLPVELCKGRGVKIKSKG